jgi:hypothetical protein
MSEQEVFWVGRKPAGEQAATAAADDPALRAALSAVCEAAGCPMQRHVAAMGPFGSWLLELQIDAVQHRAIWNGKAGRLSLDRPRPNGGWDEVRASVPAGTTPEQLGEALASLLAAQLTAVGS